MEPPRGSDLPDQNLRDFRAPSGAGWALWGEGRSEMSQS